MPEMHPKVSVVTLVNNRGDLLRETVRSVLAQTYPFHELLVIDNGSTEDIPAALAEFSDPRLRMQRIGYVGILCKLRDIGIRLATGGYVAFIDSDDLWHPDKLSISVEAALRENATMVLSDCQFFNSDGLMGRPVGATIRYPNDVFRELVEQNHSFAFGSNFFFRKMPGGPGYDTSLWVGDHDFVVMASARHKVVYIDRVLNYIRRHSENMSRPGAIFDVLCPLEYNRTAAKLLKGNHITLRQFNHIRAANYIKAGYASSLRGGHRRAVSFAIKSYCLRPTVKTARILLKVLVRKTKAVTVNRFATTADNSIAAV